MSAKKITAPKKIEIEATALDGSIKHYECETITNETHEKLSEIDEQLSSKKLNSGKALRMQCATFFGGDESDYLCHDIRVLAQIINFMTEQITNPT
jgi:hypothetical protein